MELMVMRIMMHYSSGAVYVYRLSENQWTQQAYVQGIEFRSSRHVWCIICFCPDGNTLAVGTDA